MFSLSLRRNQPHQHGRRSLVREIPCKGDVFTVRFNVQRQLRALRVQQLGRHRHLDFRVGCRGNTATLKADVQDLLAIFQRAHVQRQFPGGQAAFAILRFCRRIGNACKGNVAPSTTHQAKGQLQHVLIVRQQLVTDNRTCNVANISAAGAAAFRAMTQRMSRVAHYIDNGPMEGFWGILKREKYYGKRFTSKKELVRMIRDYIYYYNTQQVQRNPGVVTPMEKFQMAFAA